MNPEAVSALIAKNPTLKAAKAKLEAMTPGTYCVHRSWGFGQIKRYDETAQRLIIDFKDKPGHPMDPAFCVTTMEVLPANHLLVRKETDSAKIAELVAENPAQLLVEALESYPNHAATQIEIEIVLAQVVGAEKFKKWWSAAKKVIAKDPRITIPEKKTECYILREKPISAEDEILEQFKGTRSARRRIALAVELLDTANKKALKEELGEILQGVTEAVRDSNQLGKAERLHGAAVRDDLAALLGHKGELEPTQASLIADARDLPTIAETIPVQFQRRFLNLILETHPIEARDILFNLLKVSQGKFTTECINFLVEHEHGDELAATLQRWQTEQNLRAPVLLWIVKNRHSKKFAKLLHDLITPRLLSAIFFAIDYEALQSSTVRRIPLADILSDDSELIADLLSTADPETARDLANTLLLNQGFEELTKKSLLARFYSSPAPAMTASVRNTRPSFPRKSPRIPKPSPPRASTATLRKTPSTRWPSKTSPYSWRKSHCLSATSHVRKSPTLAKPRPNKSVSAPSSISRVPTQAKAPATPYWVLGMVSRRKISSPTKRHSVRLSSVKSPESRSRSKSAITKKPTLLIALPATRIRQSLESSSSGASERPGP